MTIDKQIDELQQLAAQVNCVIWDIHFCNAGIGIVWFDERRCKTPLPDYSIPTPFEPQQYINNMRQLSEITSIRSKEGSVVYNYYPTLSECLKAEKERIEKELNSSKPTPQQHSR